MTSALEKRIKRAEAGRKSAIVGFLLFLGGGLAAAMTGFAGFSGAAAAGAMLVGIGASTFKRNELCACPNCGFVAEPAGFAAR